MPIHNADIAALLDELADLLEIDDADRFRVQAYRNGARTIRELHREARLLVAEGADLTALPGIGKELAAKILEILQSGRCHTLDRLHRRLPHGLVELLALPGLGPKRVRTLYRERHIHDLDELRLAAAAGELHRLHGIGEKTEQRLLEALREPHEPPPRMPWAEAEGYVEPLLAWLRALPGVTRAEAAGEFRRRCDTVGQLDFLATAADGAAAGAAFGRYDEVEEVLEQGRGKAAVRLRCGLRATLRAVPEESRGSALHHLTGSRSHNLQLRREAHKQGLKLTEWGLFAAEERRAGADEEGLFAALGLPPIPAELREGRGELEAAHAGLLPRRLVELSDLQGSLHNHSRWSDGRNTLEEMARAALARGHRYLAFTDHSKALAVANGLDSYRLLQQLEAIDELREKLPGIVLLKGIEVDILEDGSLDLPDEILARLDLVVGSVHQGFHLSPRAQTERILRAMENRYFTLLGHPTQRLFGERDGLAVDLPRIIRAARARGCYLELNATPRRLDLDDLHCRMAREEGVLVAINADAHGVEQLDFLRYGVHQARRGWLEPQDILNSRPPAELLRLLAAVRG